MNSGVRLALAVLFTLLCVSAVAFITKPRIDASNAAWNAKRLNEIVSESLHDEKWMQHQFQFADEALGSSKPLTIFPIIKTGNWNGAVITAIAPDGYTGNITLLIAIHADHRLLGVRVTQHRETPGLGDDIDIEKSNWITSFDNLSLADLSETQWTVKKEGGYFDQFTGATITPRAVVHTVHRVLRWHELEGQAALQQHYANRAIAQ